jgi:glutamyl-tRNA synthetase
MKKGTTFRLMELYNVELTSAGLEPKARYAGEELVREMKKLQWVTPEGVGVKVLEPGLLFNEEGTFNKDSLGEANGLAEAAFKSLKPAEIVQFPRYGFCRIDSSGTCILTQR